MCAKKIEANICIKILIFYLKNYSLHYSSSHTSTQWVSECRHDHIVETGFSLLTDTSPPPSYWIYVFQLAMYLIDRMPTPFSKKNYVFETLFGQIPNYLKLRRFIFLCYLYTKPYNTHKLEWNLSVVFFRAISHHKMPITIISFKLTMPTFLDMWYSMNQFFPFP